MDLNLTTTTDKLRTAIDDALYSTGLAAEARPGDLEEATQDVLDAITRLAVAQLRPRSLERDVLAALGRAHTPLARSVIHNRATGKQSTPEDQETTGDVLTELLALGYAFQRTGIHVATGSPKETYIITDKGREALRA